MDKSLYDCLIKWLRTFAGHHNIAVNNLSDGVAMGDILFQIAPEYFTNQWKSKILTNVGGNWRLKLSNLRKIHEGVMDYLSELPGQAISQFPKPDLTKICEQGDEIELGRLLQLILGCAINCEQKQKHIEAIMKMEEGVQAHIVNAIQDMMNREHMAGAHDGDAASPSGPWFGVGPASFHPHMKTLVEQLESTSLAKEDMTRRCNELDLQLSVLTEEKEQIKKDNDKLLERIEVLESGGDIGAQSFRYKEIKKQVDTLQDELYKIETSRDEYRNRVENLERENKEITAKNEELQILAEEARSLKDEVDALKDMSDRVAVYEGTVETLKKRMEELSDLKRQIKKLEEKNSEYMQINIDLEEEVKKSATLRPQLDLYKKQVGDLHQKLAEEEKKTDRQVFENKKINEKLEAITQEKERMIVERDMLKENLEELKCTVSALSSPENARPLSELADIDTLEFIPPEIREKLVRLQHENRVLKQRANEKPNESPMLQTLLNDLQERHDKLLQENRWGDKFCPPTPFSSHWPPFGRNRQPSQSLIDAYFLLDTRRRLKLLKRNLKWASESDLLILRQPSKLMTNFLHSSSKADNKSLTLPSSSLTPVSNTTNSYHKDNPIVIRHIHEFKMPPSPTNDDSGCCRTSPSSYEGCEDHPSGSFGSHTPDYGGTLDSGVSGMYRCISPVIPSIVEECTTHHMSDILPAILGQDSNVPPIMYHSHPAHNSCFRCCSPKTLSGDSSESSTKVKVSSHTQTPCMPSSSCLNNSDDCLNKGYTIDSLHRPSRSISGTYDRPTVAVSNSSSQHDSFRKQPNTFPLRPDPPNSPTPHNSPRLPHSIHSNRSKKLSSQGHLQSIVKDFPLSQRANVYVEPEKARNKEFKIPLRIASQVKAPFVEVHTASPQVEMCSLKQNSPPSEMKNRKLELKLSQNDLIAFPDEVMTQPDVIKSRQMGGNELRKFQISEPSPPNLHERSRSKTPDRIKSMISERFRSSFRERHPEEKSLERDKGGSFRSLRSKSLDKYKAKVSSKFSNTILPSGSNNSVNDLSPQKLNVTKIHDFDISESSFNSSAIEALLDISNLKHNENYQRSFENNYSLHNKISDAPCSDINNKRDFTNANNIRGSPTYCSLRIKNPNSAQKANRPHSYCQLESSNLSRSSTPPSRTISQSSNIGNTPTQHAHSNSTNGTNNNKFSQNSINGNHVKLRKVPASLENINNDISKNAFSRNSVKSKSADITLLTDTMFTHFVVTPKRNSSDAYYCVNDNINYSSPPSMVNISSSASPIRISKPLRRQSKGSQQLVSDADTDFEMIENRLAASGFGAPLVSSESSISYQNGDQTDIEPSATDYASEMDFSPEKYKFNTSKSLLETNLDETDCFSINDTLHPLTRSDSFFKKKKMQIVGMKTKNPIGLNSKAIVKMKNKTAKAVVAETFNAMFTFCTP